MIGRDTQAGTASALSFDYVIVGGGSAGAVLANRLSAQSNTRVALFEAGPDILPGAVPKIIEDGRGLPCFDPQYHWSDLRVYRRSPLMADGTARLSPLHQAKVMGGGSSINGQFAVRGLPADYDDWQASGLPGWGWEGMLPYFCKLERDLDFAGALHGSDGRIPIRRIFPEQWAGFTKAVMRSTVALGQPYLEDYNATIEDGSFPLPLSNENDRRVSTALGYLDAQTRKRPNLTLFPMCFVERLCFEGSRATGIEVILDGRRHIVNGSEIIISAGALHSPSILMRSGIGPGAQLQDLGIQVVADSRGVGENLTDHPQLAVGAHLKRPGRIRRGMKRHICLGVRYSSGEEGCAPGDMLLMPVNRAGWSPLGLSLGALNVCVNKSYSTGTVKLKSADPTEPPAVDLNLASDWRDMTRLIDGFKRLYAVMESPEVSEEVNTWFLSSHYDEAEDHVPNARKLSNWVKSGLGALALDYAPLARDRLFKKRFGSKDHLHAMVGNDEAIAQWVRSSVWSGWHVSGTCRMGPDGDPGAVLDGECRVRGVGGLRVVDASVMPSVCSANTNVTTIAIAEKAADLIMSAG